MNGKLTLITFAALLSLLVAPASARIDGDEGGASAYPRFKKERSGMTEYCSPPDCLINRPFPRRG